MVKDCLNGLNSGGAIRENDEYRRELIARMGITIAIDGSAGSGKSTTSKIIARRLGIAYLDTGAMYRALTWYALEKQVNFDDHETVRDLAATMPFTFTTDDDGVQHFYMEDRDITSAIRESRISERVSNVSTNLLVREWMVAEQRRRMMDARDHGSGMIAEGRDTTTVVCPDADVRVLLVADPRERLRRRTLELHGEATPELLEGTRVQIDRRDAQDSRVADFMEASDGVDVINTSGLDIDESVEAVMRLVDRSLRERCL